MTRTARRISVARERVRYRGASFSSQPNVVPG